jgi:hypothetical protein
MEVQLLSKSARLTAENLKTPNAQRIMDLIAQCTYGRITSTRRKANLLEVSKLLVKFALDNNISTFAGLKKSMSQIESIIDRDSDLARKFELSEDFTDVVLDEVFGNMDYVRNMKTMLRQAKVTIQEQKRSRSDLVDNIASSAYEQVQNSTYYKSLPKDRKVTEFKSLMVDVAKVLLKNNRK